MGILSSLFGKGNNQGKGNILDILFQDRNKMISPLPDNYQMMEQSKPQQITPQDVPQETPVQQTNYGRMADTQNMKVDPVVENAIRQASQKYDIPSELLFDIAFSESSLNKNPAANPKSTATGLFQYTKPTWETVLKYAQMPGSSLSLPNKDMSDPVNQALATAYLIKFGQLGRWDASKSKWGSNYSPEELGGYYSQTK